MSKEKKLQLKLDELKAKKKKKRKKWHKFEDAGCHDCTDGIYLRKNGEGSMSYCDKIRCKCTYKKTKRYKKALGSTDLSVKEYTKLTNKFKDNNEHCKTEYYDTGRSW